MIKKGKKLVYTFIVLSICLCLGAGLLIYHLSFAKQVIRIGVYSGSSWDVPSGQDNKLLDTVIKGFEKDHPNVKVVYESGISKADYADWLSDQIVTGKQPDVFMVPENDFNLLASTGSLANLDSYVSHDLNLNRYYQASYEAGQYGSFQYALPFESNPVLLCINKDLLDKEGIALPNETWTLEEFYQICRRLSKDTDGNGSLDQFATVGYTWQEAIMARGLSLFDETGRKVQVNTSQVRSALSWYSKLEALNGSYQVSSSDFDKGKVAFMPMTLAEYRTYKSYPYHVSKYANFSWTCIAMPTQSGKVGFSQMETSLLAISSKTRKSDLAWALLKRLSANKQTQQGLFEQSQGASVLTSVMTSPKTDRLLQSTPFGDSVLKQDKLNQILKKAEPSPKFKRYTSLMEQADYLITKSLNQGTLESDLASIQRQLETAAN
ncbi:ABC transporter substrate-binding protein [Streptococcus saliviloxodontae]|nr:extracellular solute-binding protein [Streptococcus saliviloxodontae]